MNKFSRDTVVNAKYYVYGLKYPGTKDYFYIGKGKGNRVFSHLKQKLRQGAIDYKFSIINDLRNKGGAEVDIIRHGLTEYQALLIESTIIDVLGVDQISNKVRGIDADRFGLMSPKNLESLYKGKQFKTIHPCVCFKINKAWRKNMREQELYDAIRGNWRISTRRASAARYGIGVCYGVIRGIYKIRSWHQTDIDKRGRKRYGSVRSYFVGDIDRGMQKYIGYSLADNPKHKVRGPLFYLNC